MSALSSAALAASRAATSLVDRRLIGLGLDREQDLAFLDLVAVGEFARAEKAFDPRLQVDLVDGGSAADELRLRDQGLQFGRLDENGRRRQALLGRRCAAKSRAGERNRRQKPYAAHRCSRLPRLSRLTNRVPYLAKIVTLHRSRGCNDYETLDGNSIGAGAGLCRE